jgi:hypothetical protein
VIPTEEKSQLPVAFIVGLVIVAVLVTGAVVATRYMSPSGPEVLKPLPMGPTEQSYAMQIHFLEPKMSRAANLLNQEVTYIMGTVQNGGTRPIKQIEITMQFTDPFKQLVQTETERLLGPNENPLAPGEQRDYMLGYDHISAQWNQVYPSVKITGLEFK